MLKFSKSVSLRTLFLSLQFRTENRAVFSLELL